MLVALALALAVGAAPAEEAALAVGECGPGPESGADGVLFRFGRTDFREQDLSAATRQALHATRVEQYEREQQLFDAAIIDIEIARVAAETGRPKEVVARELLDVPPVGDAAIAAFYEANRAQIPYPLEAVRDRIGQMLAEQLLDERRRVVIEQVKADRGYERVALRPLAPYAEIDVDGFPSKGPADAPVTIVEFADYQCPHCRHAAAVLAEVALRHPETVRVVFMDFPINRSGISRLVAEGAACADQQGAFWPFHDLAFEAQDRLAPETPLLIAKAIELDMEAFRACLESPYPAGRVARSEAEARRLGLNSTPTLFVNGRRQHLHDLASELPALVEAELSAAGS